ncbi:hypothetical protein IG1_05157 [Bacillus cereus HD73]|nr:hypothetical protein IG1_05157 [Bacillus cereus HD73]
MKLTLLIKEEKKIFHLPEFIPARLIRQAPELADIPNNPDDIVSVIPTEKHTLSIMWKRGGMNG